MPAMPEIRRRKRKGGADLFTFECGGQRHYLGMDERLARRKAARIYADWLAHEPTTAGTTFGTVAEAVVT